MNCPVCKRSLAATLSICPTCGAMMNDTVREELQTKITSGSLPRLNAHAAPPPGAVMPKRPPIAAPPISRKHVTAGLASQKTSPTLVDFQNKNAALPDWRIQLQNAVQQRKGGPANSVAPAIANSQDPRNGGAAVNMEVVPDFEAETVKPPSGILVSKAMDRIAESRKAFFESEAKPKKPAQARPFGIVAPNGIASTAAAPARINTAPKPILVEPAPIVVKRVTNKLPPIAIPYEPPVIYAEPVDERAVSGKLTPEFSEATRIHISAEHINDQAVDDDHVYDDEIEDLAPFSMRFGAGLFDLIIGAFAGMLLLSPLVFTNGNWFGSSGLLTFVGAWALASFLYMTVCLGFFGKTIGMRLFSLELVDAVENEYPTLRQAAVSSLLFIVSIGLGGIGFLTALFNEENRAVHDLLSGTIIVREF